MHGIKKLLSCEKQKSEGIFAEFGLAKVGPSCAKYLLIHLNERDTSVMLEMGNNQRGDSAMIFEILFYKAETLFETRVNRKRDTNTSTMTG